MFDTRLTTLLAVAEYRNFTRAAEALNLTQPAVSHQIRLLEDELGHPLVVRRRGDMQLTPEGEIAVRYARRMEMLYREMTASLGKSIGAEPEKLRVGITHTAETNAITEALARYHQTHRACSITVVTDTIKNLYDKLENYELDLAVVDQLQPSPALEHRVLDTDRLVCVLPPHHRLARKASISLDDLKGEELILRLPTSATRLLLESALLAVNESLDSFRVSLEVDNIATIKGLVRKGMGVSILPYSTCAGDVNKKKLAALSIKGISMMREINILYPRSSEAQALIEEIAQLYRKILRKMEN